MIKIMIKNENMDWSFWIIILIIIQDVCISTTDTYCYNNYTTFCKRLGSQSAQYT